MNDRTNRQHQADVEAILVRFVSDVDKSENKIQDDKPFDDALAKLDQHYASIREEAVIKKLESLKDHYWETPSGGVIHYVDYDDIKSLINQIKASKREEKK